jgi:hypothetical protein
MRRSLTRPWTEPDYEVLQSMIAENAPVYRVAHRLKRSVSSVRTKMNNLGLHVRSGGDLRARRAMLRTGRGASL